MLHRFVLLCLVLSLASCGWHLRGQGPESSNLAELSGIYVAGGQDNLVAEALRSQLSFRNIPVLAQPQPNGLAILLEVPVFEQRVQTLSGDLRARQIRMQLDINISLYNYQAELLASETLQSVRSFAQNPLEPATTERQQTTLEQEMSEQVAADIIRLMSSYVDAAREDQG